MSYIKNNSPNLKALRVFPGLPNISRVKIGRGPPKANSGKVIDRVAICQPLKTEDKPGTLWKINATRWWTGSESFQMVRKEKCILFQYTNHFSSTLPQVLYLTPCKWYLSNKFWSNYEETRYIWGTMILEPFIFFCASLLKVTALQSWWAFYKNDPSPDISGT